MNMLRMRLKMNENHPSDPLTIQKYREEYKGKTLNSKNNSFFNGR